ncbi:MAG: LysR family transcriptional regulator [Actinomycetota bacterium]|nr:LysR family transcriptional regulator [Actinomycetota bacterium]
MTPDLRLVRYFVAVAREGNVTRAAEILHISQPSLSAAVKQLEQQLGVALLERSGRRIALTAAGELLLRRGKELLEHADAVADEVSQRDSATAGRLRLGLTPTARYGVGPDLLAACARNAPGVMIYTSEDTTGALLRDVAQGRVDLAVTFCAPEPPEGMVLALLREESALVHMPSDHRLAGRRAVRLEDLVGESILVSAGRDSSGFTDRVLSAFAAAGIAPRTRADPYPDLGLQAVREGLGVVVYSRSAFPQQLAGSAFVPLQPPLGLPFHLASRKEEKGAAARAVLEIAEALRAQSAL